MALVKTSKIASSVKGGAAAAPPEGGPARRSARRAIPAAPASPTDKISERVAAATEELASGLTQASAAAEELRRSMEQIASGADEAAGAAQEQLAAIRTVAGNLGIARGEAETARRRTEAVQLVLAETAAQVTTSVRAIERNAERQSASIGIIAELERRAQDIGTIAQAVGRISDQTNLLALNAAIEAARAGEQGRGFAVVADEVRTLAETSEKSAQDTQSLSDTMQKEVREVVVAIRAGAETAITEAKAGGGVVRSLGTIREDMSRLSDGSQETVATALEAERAAVEAQRGAEQIAGAAEEQSSASSHAQTAIRQQAQSLEQGQAAAQGLARLAEKLRAGRADASAAEQISATAEELSATVQELSTAASEIMAAVEQINRGSQQQASATHQASAAFVQIEKSARLAQERAAHGGERVAVAQAALTDNRTAIESLVSGVATALEATRSSLVTILRLEGAGRRIETIVDGIGLVAIQTSMLAVSGAVEAARAGTAGRGFATVSNDIRALAREASDSVARIKDTVRGILDQIASLRRDLEQVIASGEAEIQTNRSIFAALEKVDGEVALLSAANGAIVKGADAILAAAVEMAAGARQVAAAAEEANAASRQAAAASTEQAQGAEDLAAAIEEIASLADELKQQNA